MIKNIKNVIVVKIFGERMGILFIDNVIFLNRWFCLDKVIVFKVFKMIVVMVDIFVINNVFKIGFLRDFDVNKFIY